ncbi:pseudouridylate synthase 1 homolog [Procambarus clarkii]|uniref:pseudouridylate synthase 1 homolog n=1 Tax=Procambarus clarkii TaxID=6728 RepID=UPI001E677AB6|nr:tRNA pseudouridine synthase A-like [Procambarus clarkii]
MVLMLSRYWHKILGKFVRWIGPWPEKKCYNLSLEGWFPPKVAETLVSGKNNQFLPDLANTSVKYDPEHEMTEAEVKHIKLTPVPEISTEKIRKKFALLLSFNGQGYHGLQTNTCTHTIEKDLFAAMHAADLITRQELFIPQLYFYQRSSRTDKGVSAARLLVSASLPVVPNVDEEINKHLCDQIRVMAVYRVYEGFNCKIWCDSRTYSYLCPTFAFAPYSERVCEDYRISQEVLEDLRKLLHMYKGRHKFHNFTSHVKCHSARAWRNIIDIDCGQPFERDGLEWLSIKITGESFLLHQIRKMIALTIAICRGLTTYDTITRAFEDGKMDIPLVPANGLVLDDQHFNEYNRKYARILEPLNWDKAEKKIQKFREQNIDLIIFTKEIKEKEMLKWLINPHFFTYHLCTSPSKEENEIDEPNSQATSLWLAQKKCYIDCFSKSKHQKQKCYDEDEDKNR